MQELTKEMAARLKLGVEHGVIVTDVADNSIAADQDIQREDVITEVDGKGYERRFVPRSAEKADPRKGVLLYLDRKGSKTFAVLKANGARQLGGIEQLRLLDVRQFRPRQPQLFWHRAGGAVAPPAALLSSVGSPQPPAQSRRLHKARSRSAGNRYRVFPDA